MGFRRNQPVSWLLKEKNGKVKRYTPPATYEFADGDAMLEAVLAGCGFAQLPLWMVGKYLESGELKEVLQEYSGIEIPINALWPQNRHYLLPKIRYVVDTLVEMAESGLLN